MVLETPDSVTTKDEEFFLYHLVNRFAKREGILWT